ncbi:hypothetical protein HMPREF0424_0752 [Gardnerella vaginalis 409-05]|uniref:nucleotide-binding domain-containing protein n=1 Tax=Gardnerella TaxID=2701 RepID=UPI0001C21C16|nr:nucleotidyltransferase [Gardnerella swidsinskii]ADB13865.1 hypothetical protein HMPREF0424_0752 [Gardnerella vaginalis 409-05]MDK8692165.1 nucleotidyltransferase [Gardnerella swidsinskii]
MSALDIFDKIFDNIQISNKEEIRKLRDEITKALNKEFRNSYSKSDNWLMVGSWGRHTAIDGVSDLDLLYILPSSLWDDYHTIDGTKKVLSKVKQAIVTHYSRTDIRVDRLVVVVNFKNYKFEVQPVFEQDDGSFLYPDTYSDSWKTTKPRDEIKAISNLDETSMGNARKICKLARAWKNKHSVLIGGLLIDTMAWRFLNDNDEYFNTANHPDYMIRDFFEYISNLPKQESWNALGSNQRVKVKKNFQEKAAEAYNLCRAAIDEVDEDKSYMKWREVFGRFVPLSDYEQVAKDLFTSYDDTEQFIENFYPIDLQYELNLECKVTQDGFRPASLRDMIRNHIWLKPNKKLEFYITNTDLSTPYSLKWKVCNCGEEAKKRNCIRGQIIDGTTSNTREEHTVFRGEHYVECYAIHYGVVITRGKISVPITTD